MSGSMGSGVVTNPKAPAVSGLPGVLTPTGYQLPSGLSFEEWSAVGDRLLGIRGAIRWSLGDWLGYGEVAYGERYSQAIDPQQAEVWQQYVYVSRRFEISRRLENVSWSVHQALAGVKDDRERYALLERAAVEEWTVQQAREQVRGLKDPAKEPEAEPGESVVSGAYVFTYFASKEILMVQKIDRKTGVVLDRAEITREAVELVQRFLDETEG